MDAKKHWTIFHSGTKDDPLIWKVGSAVKSASDAVTFLQSVNHHRKLLHETFFPGWKQVDITKDFVLFVTLSK